MSKRYLIHVTFPYSFTDTEDWKHFKINRKFTKEHSLQKEVNTKKEALSIIKYFNGFAFVDVYDYKTPVTIDDFDANVMYCGYLGFGKWYDEVKS